MKILAVQGNYVLNQILEIDIEKALSDFTSQIGTAFWLLDKDTCGNFYYGDIGFPTTEKIRNAIEQKLRKTNIERLDILKQRLDKDQINILAKELGIKPAKFDHLEWNKLALEESRKERGHWRPDESQKSFT